MHKLCILGVAAAVLLGACGGEPASAPPASASEITSDTFTEILSNTMRVVAKDGTEQNWLFEEDGTFISLAGVSGTWTLEGDTLCTLYGERTTPGCFDLPPGKAVGDTWDQVVGSGQTMSLSIVAGR